MEMVRTCRRLDLVRPRYRYLLGERLQSRSGRSPDPADSDRNFDPRRRLVRNLPRFPSDSLDYWPCLFFREDSQSIKISLKTQHVHLH
jgi:hypothetical protein